MPGKPPPPRRPGGHNQVVRIDEVRKAAVAATLQMNRGNISATARDTGVSRTTVRKAGKMEHDETLLRDARTNLAQTCAVIALKCGKILMTDEVLLAIAAGPHPDRLATVMGISVDKLDALTTGPKIGAGDALVTLLQELRLLRTTAAG